MGTSRGQTFHITSSWVRLGPTNIIIQLGLSTVSPCHTIEQWRLQAFPRKEGGGGKHFQVLNININESMSLHTKNILLCPNFTSEDLIVVFPSYIQWEGGGGGSISSF